MECNGGISEEKRGGNTRGPPIAAGNDGRIRIPFPLTRHNAGSIMDLMKWKKLWLATGNENYFIPAVYEMRSAIW